MSENSNTVLKPMGCKSSTKGKAYSNQCMDQKPQQKAKTRKISNKQPATALGGTRKTRTSQNQNWPKEIISKTQYK